MNGSDDARQWTQLKYTLGGHKQYTQLVDLYSAND
jgi:hypothetical protein